MAKKFPVPVIMVPQPNQPSAAYDLVLLRVETRLENGAPDQVTIVRDNQTVELSQDKSQNHFITAYLPREMLNRGPKNA